MLTITPRRRAHWVNPAGSSLLNGLQAYYKLEDLTDSSGNALTLTDHGTVTFVAGKLNNAGNFVASSNQYLTHADAAPYKMGAGTNFTIAAWFKAASGDANRRSIALYGSLAVPIGYGIWRWDEFIQASIADGTNSARSEATGMFDNNWHLAAATFDRTGVLTLYVDNSQVGTTPSISSVGSTNDSAGFNIGAQVDATFNGNIDEVGIWNRVLTSGELTSLWNGGTGVTYPFS